MLALVAILPEYAIEAVLAWDAGGSFNLETKEVTDEMGRVAANVTGSNRLLIGLGWSLVILIFWLKRRTVMDLRGALSLEITMLAIATALTLIIFITGQLTWYWRSCSSRSTWSTCGHPRVSPQRSRS